MDIYQTPALADLLRGNRYPGRGIVMGTTPRGRAAAVYFIMGRSANSRNRVFVEKEGALFTEPYDAAKVQDPSLIIYAAVRRTEKQLIVTNGDQTDTIYEALQQGRSFGEALETRSFEPDAPNFTPRISGLITFGDGNFTYQMSILKSADAIGSACVRSTFSYPALPGVGHFLHTYVCDGNPLPAFQGEPERVAIPEDIDAFAEEVWDALDEENKISLYVRFVDPKIGWAESWIMNKNI